MTETFVATAVSVTITGDYDDTTVTGPVLEFVATRGNLESAHAELAGWTKRHVQANDVRDFLFHIVRLNEFGDEVERLRYEPVTTIDLVDSRIGPA